MKLLLDQNLSPALVKRLADLFPNSVHVQDLGLDRESDRQIWAVAANEGYAILTKDNDFNELSQILGFPPYVIWIQRGNCSTREIEGLLRQRFSAIQTWERQASPGLMVVL